MRHLATILRNTGASNSWGQKDAGWTAVHTNVMCRAWPVSNQVVIAPGEIADVEAFHLAFPLGTDVLQTDRIGDVTYRGTVILNGYMYIDDLTIWDDRLEVVLRRSGG
jgi:hypothetical protein